MSIDNVQDFGFYSSAPLEDYLQKSFVGQMIRYAPNGEAGLFALTSLNGKGNCLNSVHQYMTKTMVYPRMVLDGAIADGAATNFQVDSTANVLVGDVYQAYSPTANEPFGEQVRVTAVVNATNVTVIRGYAVEPAEAHADNTVLIKVGNAFENASDAPAPLAMNPVPVQNNTQIFRNSWAVSGSAAAIMPIVGDSLVAENKQDCGMFHAADIEKALIFGQKKSGTLNGQYIGGMDGVISQLRAHAPLNITVAGATTNFTEFEAATDPVFNTQVTGSRSGNERILYTGSQGLRVCNNIGKLNGEYELVDGQTSFGLRFKTFRTTRGLFRLIEHPYFNSSPELSKMALIVDPSVLKLKYLIGRDTTHTKYGQDGKYVQDGQDAIGGTLLSELTLENLNPSAHCVITNLTTAAVG